MWYAALVGTMALAWWLTRKTGTPVRHCAWCGRTGASYSVNGVYFCDEHHYLLWLNEVGRMDGER